MATKRDNVLLPWEQIRRQYPSLAAYLNAASQFQFVRQTLHTQFEDLAMELLPLIGSKGALKVTIEADTFTIRFGVNKSKSGGTGSPKSTSSYQELLAKAIECGAGYHKTKPAFALIFPDQRWARNSYSEAQYNALVATAGPNDTVETNSPSKLVRSFIFCRQQERNLEKLLPALREAALVDVAKLSTDLAYQIDMPKGSTAVVSPFNESTPTLVRNHPDYHEWHEKLSAAQKAKPANNSVAVPKFTPYFSLT